MSLYSTVLPFAVDFAAWILELCEKFCDLVSSSGLLRVDITSVECKYLEDVHNDTPDKRIAGEKKLRLQQKRPNEWNITGRGFIVRFLLNEVSCLSRDARDVSCLSRDALLTLP